ncbi:hypothetical protein CHLNCDRAFT_134688 [Chlorella variabilis]|uniref:PPM-type phosphatase domain-containing protein n=1 Tax=Chlorella variabilis TaxID=554065 RepID=E1ZGI9_CHLVA|nr:hypothetical protein CHLNCDRAFT_134688 [Chlorella variabilis]EFN54940.1 hypothetical protein CHLNCDRAFT_134688 [Chlorella variabilis]|eukprot:XP_005847042.1 hypothetical protein CHLNCDRAFT_134688 [Chlorella variabilis]
MHTAWSNGIWDGRRGEDRLVAVQRLWPNVAVAAADAGSPEELLSSCCWLQPREHHKPSYCLFAVFDGHNGPRAARFAADNVAQIVEGFLPPWVSNAADPAAPAPQMAAQLQEALVLAFLELHRQFGGVGRKGGCTATVALQAGRLLTVASLGSGRCVLDMGCLGSLLTLSVEHRISSNVAERQRLSAAGCEVAYMDVGSLGPARHPGRGDGVLRLWPGGLALSRSIGDFAISEAVLLPPSGGRLILATEGVWGHGQDLLQLMHNAPLKTASFKVVKAISTSRQNHVDASIIVADILPPRVQSFQSVCRRQQQQPVAAPAVTSEHRHRQFLDSSTEALKMLFRRSGGIRQPEEAMPPAPALAPPSASDQSQVVASAELLADIDSAALLGLAPWGGSDAGSTSAPRAGSFSSTSSAGAGARAQMMAAIQAQQQTVWFVQPTEQLMWRLLREASQLWHDVRRRQRDIKAAAALSAAAAEEQSLLAVLVRSTPSGRVQSEWLEASAAAATAAGGAANQQEAHLTSSSTSSIGSSHSGGSDEGGPVILGSANGSGAGSLNERLLLLSPKAAGSGRWRAACAVSPGSASALVTSGSWTSRSRTTTLGRSSSSGACPVPALSPKLSLEDRALRRRAPGELAASPGTKWMRAYSCVAGVLTKAGSAYSNRNMEAAAGVDSWTEAYGSMAGQYMSRKGQA